MSTWIGARTARSLVRSPDFAAPALLCLTLTIGAAIAVFAVVDAVALRPLPYPQPDRIRSVYATIEQSGDQHYSLSAAKIELLSAGVPAFERQAAWQGGAATLTGRGQPRQLNVARVTADFFAVLGAQPLLGGGFAGAVRDGGTAAYVSEGFWRRELGGAHSAIGERLVIDDVPHTLLGVVRGRQVVPPLTDIWLPLRLDEVPADRRHSGNFGLVARMAAGATTADVTAQLERVATAIAGRYPDNYASHSLGSQTLRDDLMGDAGPLLSLLLGAVALLVVVGSANVANLVLVRNRRRAPEMVTRAALGATRAAMIRWLMSELVLVALLAASIGLALASLVAPALLRLTEIAGPGMEVRLLDPRTLVFVVGITLGAGLGPGLLPALRARRTELARVLRESAGSSTQGRSGRRAHGLLIAGQTTLGVLLVIAAGQTLLELGRLARVDPGFRTDGITTLRIQAPEPSYPEPADYRRLFAQIRESLGTVAGVEAVSATTGVPIGDPGAGFSLSIEDRPPADPNQVEVAQGRLLLPGYLEALGVPLVEGRLLGPADTEQSQRVVVVSRSFAERYWPDRSAVGRRIKRRTWSSEFPWLEVVGVVEDVRIGSLDREIGPTVYFPHSQTFAGFARTMTFVVRSGRQAAQLVPELRARLNEVDPDLPVSRVATMQELIAESIATRRLTGQLLGLFAGAGLILLATGTYGVVASSTARRQTEIGLRRALGADTRSLLGMILREQLAFVVGGIALGTGIALAGSRLPLAVSLPSPSPALHLLAAALLLTTGFAATLRPALRAIRRDATFTLRSR